jgi:Uma2 family endonuclease
MASASHPGLLNFDEFLRLPNPATGHYELHQGALVQVPPPKYKHFLMLQKLRTLLQAAAGDAGLVYTELGIRVLPEGEYRQVDIAYGPHAMWSRPDPEGYFLGSPELVVEVLSPSNSKAAIAETMRLCLANGCREFWVVDMDRKTIEVRSVSDQKILYREGDKVPLLLGGELSVRALFE